MNWVVARAKGVEETWFHLSEASGNRCSWNGAQVFAWCVRNCGWRGRAPFFPSLVTFPHDLTLWVIGNWKLVSGWQVEHREQDVPFNLLQVPHLGPLACETFEPVFLTCQAPGPFQWVNQAEEESFDRFGFGLSPLRPQAPRQMSCEWEWSALWRVCLCASLPTGTMTTCLSLVWYLSIVWLVDLWWNSVATLFKLLINSERLLIKGQHALGGRISDLETRVSSFNKYSVFTVCQKLF